MKRLSIMGFLLLSLMLVMVACGSDVPEVAQDDIETADEVVSFDFESDASGFETGNFGQSALAVNDGHYQIQSNSDSGNHYLVGSNRELNLKNIVVEVEVRRVNGSNDSWAGVVCRTHGNDLGYALLISGDGFWSIARIDESASGFQSLDYLREWRETSAINTSGNNELLIYCVDDYLALYVNGEFVGEDRDDNYDLSGGLGFLAGGTENEAVTIAFDNVSVRSAYREGNPNTATPTDEPEPTATPTAEPPPTLAPLPSIGDATDAETDTQSEDDASVE